MSLVTSLTACWFSVLSTESKRRKRGAFFSLDGAEAFDVYILYSPLYVGNKLVIIGIIFIS